MRKLKIDDFDFIDYYKNTLTTRYQRDRFRELIKKKLGLTDHQTIHNWIACKKSPGYVDIIIVDIINGKDYDLPKPK